MCKKQQGSESPSGIERLFRKNAPNWKAWIAILAIGTSVCVASSIPYLAGWFVQTPELRYAWVGGDGPGDSLSYFAKIGQGQQGQWLFHLPYTAQTHAGIPIYTYYLLLGRLSRWLALPIPLTFHLMRVLNGMILLIVVYAFIRQLTEIENERRFILTLVAVSSGLGWLAASVQLQSSDLTIAESNTFYTLMDNPHFPLSQTLLLLLVISYLPPAPANSKRAIGGLVFVALASIALASLQPHMMAIAWGIGVIYGAWLWWDTRELPQALLMRLMVSLVSGGVVIGVIAVSLYSDPLFRQMTAQNLNLSPPIISYLIGYILLIIPAVYGARWALRARPQAARLMIVWCVVTFLALYAPTTIQRRFISGVHVPLAILAGLGICRVWMPRGKVARRWGWVYLVLTCLTSAALVIGFTRTTLARSPKLFLSAGESRALAWLQEHAPPDGVVLSSPKLGAFVPAFTTQRAVVGHWTETVNFAETSQKVQYFFSTAANSFALCAGLTQWGVNYVLIGPRERNLGAKEEDFAKATSLTQVAHLDDVRIYQVNCPATWQLYDHLEPITVNFDGGISLTGVAAGLHGGAQYSTQAVIPVTSTANSPLWFALRWRADQPPKANYRASLRLFDAAGNQVFQQDGAVAGWENKPSSQWQPGASVESYHLLPLPENLAPGTYELRLIVYDEATLTPTVQVGVWQPEIPLAQIEISP